MLFAEEQTLKVLIETLTQMGEERDDYFEKLKKWKELQQQLRTKRRIDDIPEDLLLTLAYDFEKLTLYVKR